jgi:succinate dehydrogenase / fumarate reductase flavoprotein subunit
MGVYLDFAEAIEQQGRTVIESRYGNLFAMYRQITGEDPYLVPMRIYPAPHYTMGGLWVDYNLMSTTPGLFVIGEANFSDHGANRLGASALMQGLADGYFILPQTIGAYFAGERLESVSGRPEFAAAEQHVNAGIRRLLQLDGNRSVESIHRELGRILWEACGMTRSRPALREALVRIPELRNEFWANAAIPGRGDSLNMALEKAGRIADFLELGELMCHDALAREESCGCHLREEYQSAEGEAKRNDDQFCHVAVWQYQGDEAKPTRHQEELTFEEVQLVERSYK